MKTNILSLSFRKVDCPKSPSYLVGELRIDGQLLGDRYVKDVRRLAEALACFLAGLQLVQDRSRDGR